MKKNDQYYVVAREPGAENPAIPTWANNNANPLNLGAIERQPVTRIDLDDIPGAFQVLDVLSADECQQLIDLSEDLGYVEDAAVSLPRSIRHNHSLTWVVDQMTSDAIWSRCKASIDIHNELFFNKKALGLNNRFRFYRYQVGDYFAPHTDGAWPGSNVVDGRLEHNAFDDRWSQLTFLLYLNDDFEGGQTQFITSQSAQTHSLDQLMSKGRNNFNHNVRTPQGGVLCFPHGTHPQHCVHSSTAVSAGAKYIIRTDVLFEL